MRAFFLLVILAGLALAAGYPFYINNFSGEEIGAWTVYERDGGFRPVDVALRADQAPVRVFVDLTVQNSAPITPNVSVLTLTANLGSRTVLAKALDFIDSNRKESSPQQQQAMLRASAGDIDPVEDATYRFVVDRGEVDGLFYSRAELILRGAALPLDPRALPIGFVLIAVGLVGFVLTLRRRERRADEPPQPRWGRGGGQ